MYAHHKSMLKDRMSTNGKSFASIASRAISKANGYTQRHQKELMVRAGAERILKEFTLPTRTSAIESIVVKEQHQAKHGKILSRMGKFFGPECVVVGAMGYYFSPPETKWRNAAILFGSSTAARLLNKDE